MNPQIIIAALYAAQSALADNIDQQECACESQRQHKDAKRTCTLGKSVRASAQVKKAIRHAESHEGETYQVSFKRESATGRARVARAKTAA